MTTVKLFAVHSQMPLVTVLLLCLTGCAINAPTPAELQSPTPVTQSCKSPDAATTAAMISLIPGNPDPQNVELMNPTVVQADSLWQVLSFGYIIRAVTVFGDGGPLVYSSLIGAVPSQWKDITDEQSQYLSDPWNDYPGLSQVDKDIYLAAYKAWSCTVGG